MEKDSELNMLSFFAVRGICPDYLLSLSPIEKSFYRNSMQLYYKELNLILEMLIKALQGGVMGSPKSR